MKITLANLSSATAQQVFDQVAVHLLTQRAKSINGYGCSYRGDHGRKCAAGCLIADTEYKEVFEDRVWPWLVRNASFPSEHVRLVDGLQTVHDKYEPFEWAY